MVIHLVLVNKIAATVTLKKNIYPTPSKKGSACTHARGSIVQLMLVLLGES